MKVFDPVCGMELDLAHRFVERTHDGQTIHFCSLECAEKFDEDPEKYIYPEEHLGPAQAGHD